MGASGYLLQFFSVLSASWQWDKLGSDDSSEQHGLEWNDYPESNVDYSRLTTPDSHAQPLVQQILPTYSASHRTNSAMASLLGLDSLRAGGVPAQDPTFQQNTLPNAHPQSHCLGTARSYAPPAVGMTQGDSATERFLLRARLNSLSQKRLPGALYLDQARQSEIDSAVANTSASNTTHSNAARALQARMGRVRLDSWIGRFPPLDLAFFFLICFFCWWSGMIFGQARCG